MIENEKTDIPATPGELSSAHARLFIVNPAGRARSFLPAFGFLSEKSFFDFFLKFLLQVADKPVGLFLFRRMTASVTGRRRRSQRRNFFCALPFHTFLSARSNRLFLHRILLSPHYEREKKIKQAACPLHGAEPEIQAMARADGFGIADEE
ncbi:MAG TPA: hypothetical protein VE999_13315, partial [Gemmataceae bacterium]|nr:hypothetical protein [Gemmataceae bacterium]